MAKEVLLTGPAEICLGLCYHNVWEISSPDCSKGHIHGHSVGKGGT